MSLLVAAGQIWRDGALQTGQAVEITAGRVSRIRPLGQDRPDARVALLMPGATDLQVNGGGGVLFNSTPTPEGLAAIAAAHRGLGTVSILPTVITDAPEVTDAAADAVIAAMALGAPGIAGIHIEGPHLAPARRGTHDARFIRPLDRRMIETLARLRGADVPVMLTLAPELADPALMAEAVAMGVRLSAGHSMANAEETRAALSRGVTLFTHLFNAMPQMTSREPGIIAAAILSDAYCGLIADGIHVSPEMIRIALAARPVADRVFLVSDAMPTVGGPDRFRLYDMEIRVEDGRLVNTAGALAGAHIDMIGSIRWLHRNCGVDLAQAVAMATDIPRRAMGLAPLAIAEGVPVADLVALDEDLQLSALPAA
ncbi:MAG: N-acetylglucosamine-6-phosphate deacetylase [Paracoccus sp. (in: a-proteobacteria)]|nr:N-acetylglucosamine-6-phosphate deacetylase [Paracoccus sp. (in: a-proteobacteria)]